MFDGQGVNAHSQVFRIDVDQAFIHRLIAREILARLIMERAGTHSWVSTVLIPEIPKGFTQTYLGVWGNTSRSDVNLVRLTVATGTIEYTDHCALNLGYAASANHIVWGNGNLWPSLNAPSIPSISKGVEGVATDYMLHFGNHVRGSDDQTIVGEPAYVNVIWNTYR